MRCLFAADQGRSQFVSNPSGTSSAPMGAGLNGWNPGSQNKNPENHHIWVLKHGLLTGIFFSEILEEILCSQKKTNQYHYLRHFMDLNHDIASLISKMLDPTATCLNGISADVLHRLIMKLPFPNYSQSAGQQAKTWKAIFQDPIPTEPLWQRGLARHGKTTFSTGAEARSQGGIVCKDIWPQIQRKTMQRGKNVTSYTNGSTLFTVH